MTIHRRQPSRLGIRLSDLRQQLYLRREHVAERSGISVHLLQSLEQGRTANPTVHTVLGLARALKVPVSELIDCIALDLEADRSSQPESAPGKEPAHSSQ